MTKFSNKKRELNPIKTQAGFIQIILMVIGALVLLRYIYDIDIVAFLTQGRFKEILDQIYNLGTKGWAKYSETLIRVWNYIFDLAKNLLARFK